MLVLKRRPGLLPVLCSGFSTLLFIQSCRPSLERTNASKPNVVLITVDTLRADHLECYGYRRIRTPHINRLAEDGILFENAYSHSPLTLPSHWSILTGTYPFVHGIKENAFFSTNSNIVNLAQILKGEGYSTAAFVGAFVLDRRFGLGKGFDHYYDNFDWQSHSNVSPADVQRSGDKVVSAFEDWLSQAKTGALFAWVHLYDPHDPYQPPPPFDQEYAQAPYDGEIAFVDTLIGRIVSHLGERALENTLIVLTGDHGESLGEHSEDTHGYFIYDSSLHVPLIMRVPGRHFGGAKVKAQVRSIDIIPTVLGLAGLKKPSTLQGVSLVPLLHNPGLDLELASYSETYYPRYHFGVSELRALRTQQFKYIKAPVPELYDVVADPTEQNNLFGSQPSTEKKLDQRLTELTNLPVDRALTERGNDPGSAEKLRSLGYLASSPQLRDSRPDNGVLPDPKDRIELYSATQRALAASNLGNTKKAIELFEGVLRQDSSIPAVSLGLAIEYQRVGNHRSAARVLESLLTFQPSNALAAFNLAVSYTQLGRHNEALKNFSRTLDLDPTYSKAYTGRGILYQKLGQTRSALLDYENSIKIDPRDFVALNNMAVVYAQERRLDEATAKIHRSLEINPENGEALLTLGSIHFLKKDYDAALKAYQSALSAGLNSIQLQVNLGLTYQALGMLDQAIRSFKQAIAISPDSPEPIYYLGQTYQRMGLAAQAQQQFRKSEALRQKNLRPN